MRVLLTNFMVASRTGAELYTYDVALALLARGHSPIVYATVLGPLADQLRAATVPVVDDLSAISAVPDVLHGHPADERPGVHARHARDATEPR